MKKTQKITRAYLHGSSSFRNIFSTLPWSNSSKTNLHTSAASRCRRIEDKASQYDYTDVAMALLLFSIYLNSTPAAHCLRRGSADNPGTKATTSARPTQQRHRLCSDKVVGVLLAGVEGLPTERGSTNPNARWPIVCHENQLTKEHNPATAAWDMTHVQKNQNGR